MGLAKRSWTNKDNYDHVVVCTDTNAVPFIPELPGAESFAGEIVHSGEIRDLSTLTGKKVVLVGLLPPIPITGRIWPYDYRPTFPIPGSRSSGTNGLIPKLRPRILNSTPSVPLTSIPSRPIRDS